MARVHKRFIMKDNFKKDVSESLLHLHARLLRRAKRQNFSKERSAKVMGYLNSLQMVAHNAGAYCNPAYFNQNMQKSGFDVPTDFSLFDVDKDAAQCVYDIMICRRDYIFWGDKNLQKKSKFDSYKYKSQQEAIEAMRLLKRDSIIMTGGFVVNYVCDLWNSVFNRSK